MFLTVRRVASVARAEAPGPFISGGGKARDLDWKGANISSTSLAFGRD
jgi:hypothetical protein